MDERQGGSRRVVLHVGAPKTGTTFLQRTLWGQRSALLDLGVTCPGVRERDMFFAAVEVREAYGTWGLDAETLNGTWSRLCRDAKQFGGTTIMSHELLGAATKDQIEHALAELDGEHVEIVFTTRDLARQVTSDWQERLKNGGTRSFKSFARRIAGQIREENFSSGFWRAQDPAGALGRWAADIPPERVHVVVCPPPGLPPEELWHRFGAACGFDAHGVGLALDGPQNRRLGVVQAGLLRRVNKALDGRIPQPQYSQIVKHQFAQGTLAAMDSPGPRCPADLVDLLRSVAKQRNEVLRSRGYTIHGDLDELVPPLVDGSAPDPDDVGVREQLDAAAAAIAELLIERVDLMPPRPVGAALAEQALQTRARRLLRRAVHRRRSGSATGR